MTLLLGAVKIGEFFRNHYRRSFFRFSAVKESIIAIFRGMTVPDMIDFTKSLNTRFPHFQFTAFSKEFIIDKYFLSSHVYPWSISELLSQERESPDYDDLVLAL